MVQDKIACEVCNDVRCVSHCVCVCVCVRAHARAVCLRCLQHASEPTRDLCPAGDSSGHCMLHHSLQSPLHAATGIFPHTALELHSDTHLHHQHVSLRRLLWRSHFDDSLSARAVRWRCSKWDDWWVTCSTVSVTCIPLHASPIVVVSDSRGHTEKQNNGSGGESHLVAWPRSQ